MSMNAVLHYGREQIVEFPKPEIDDKESAAVLDIGAGG